MTLLAVALLLNSGVGNASLGSTDCGACHSTDDWGKVVFDHSTTRLPLEGRHQGLPCGACHADLSRLARDPSCGSCHLDPHGGRLGVDCQRCHEQDSFRVGLFREAHRSTRFPLYGRHELIACDQCHRSRVDRSFHGVPTRCIACHSADYASTAATQANHAASGVGTDCEDCHSSVSWLDGRLPEHDRCFPLTSGDHRRIRCQSCHSTHPGLVVSQCASFSASCSRCHRCGEMDKKHREEERVSGYECVDRKCYECHPSGEED